MKDQFLLELIDLAIERGQWDFAVACIVKLESNNDSTRRL